MCVAHTFLEGRSDGMLQALVPHPSAQSSPWSGFELSPRPVPGLGAFSWAYTRVPYRRGAMGLESFVIGLVIGATLALVGIWTLPRR